MGKCVAQHPRNRDNRKCFAKLLNFLNQAYGHTFQSLPARLSQHFSFGSSINSIPPIMHINLISAQVFFKYG